MASDNKSEDESVEGKIEDLANGWLKSYNLNYELKNASLNKEIDNALERYESKSGGKGGNYPDAKLLLKNSYGEYFPVMIEYKGYKNKLVKFDEQGSIANKKKDSKEPLYSNIKSYAVNGAVHYAQAIIQYTSYKNIIAIGMTGWKDNGVLKHEIGVYLVSADNLAEGKEITQDKKNTKDKKNTEVKEIKKYTDLSFLSPEHFDDFIKTVKNINLTPEERERIKAIKEREIEESLLNVNQDIYKDEKNISERHRVLLVMATIIATIGTDGVKPLELSDLKSSEEKNSTDGDIILGKIDAFISKRNMPQEKFDTITASFKEVLINNHINKPQKGETQLKRVFTKIYDDLGLYYKIGITTDFTGKLFNEMYKWLGFTQDKLNDVVLTPPYIATLLSKLSRVNKDSYVWDFATGSAGLLVAAMNEMIIDAKSTIQSPKDLEEKIAHIKANQLLGIEVMDEIYMLAVLNMILMGDGSSNIIHDNSLEYAQANNNDFPATAFVLNPPYSADGNGMIFVQEALRIMESGYASVIIQGSAGSGKAISYNREILKKNRLIASIKMPIDLFVGKSSVQTYIYVFEVGHPHKQGNIVKFIDFTNDGYKRTSRKKSKTNLRDIDRAKERYQELVDLVENGKSKLKIFTEKEYYEGQIDPESGKDWNQTAPIDTTPTLQDFKKTVADYLSWEVSNLLKQEKEDERLGK